MGCAYTAQKEEKEATQHCYRSIDGEQTKRVNILHSVIEYKSQQCGNQSSNSSINGILCIQRFTIAAAELRVYMPKTLHDPNVNDQIGGKVPNID